MIREILTAAVGMFTPIILMMLTDLITGLWKAFKTNAKITSSKLRNTISKTVVYFLVLLICGCLSTLGEESVGLLFAVFIGLIEGISILENLSVIFPQFQFINKMKEQLLNKKKKTDGNE